MATIIGRATADIKITLEISYAEAKALHALTVYGTNPFIQAFYKMMGKAYLEPHAAGLKSLFEAFSNLPAITKRFEDAKEVFNGYKTAVRSKE